MTKNTANEYTSRSDLAHKINELRGKTRIPFLQKSGKKLAENLLAEQKSTDNYQDALNRKYARLLKQKDGLPKTFDKKIALSLISIGNFGNPRASLPAKHIDRFSPSDHKEIAMTMIKYGLVGQLLSHIDKFQGLDTKEIAIKILSESEYREIFILYIDKFPSLDRNQIAAYLMQNNSGWLVAKHLDKFPGLDDDLIAQSKKDLVAHEELLHRRDKRIKDRDSFERACKKENIIAAKARQKKEEQEKAATLKKILILSLGFSN